MGADLRRIWKPTRCHCTVSTSLGHIVFIQMAHDIAFFSIIILICILILCHCFLQLQSKFESEKLKTGGDGVKM